MKEEAMKKMVREYLSKQQIADARRRLQKGAMILKELERKDKK